MRLARPFRFLYDRYFGYDVFISYSRRSSTDYATSLLRQLKALGISCFLDQGEIYAGASIDPLILTAIERSSAVVPIITKGTEASAYVPAEIAHALRLGKQIVPISVADEVRAGHWSSIQRFRWIDETEGAARSGVPADGVAAQIRQNFTALRRAQFRRLLLGAAGLTLSAAGLLAYLAHREALVQESFGLYSRGLEAAASKDRHAAGLYFAAALERNDTPQIRSAMASVLEGLRWRWDFQVPLEDGAKPGNGELDPPPKIAFSRGPDPALLVLRGRRLLALDADSGRPRRICAFLSLLTGIAVDGATGSIAVGDSLGHIYMFRDSSLNEPRSLTVDGPVSALKFDADGSLLGVGIEGGGLRVLDPATGEQWYRSPSGQHEQTVSAIAFARKSSQMVWSMGRWLYASEPLTRYLHLIGPQNDDIGAVAWNTEADVVAAAGIDGRIQLINLHQNAPGPRAILSTRSRATPDLQELEGHSDGITTMQLLGAEALLASAGFDGRLKLWNLGRGELSFSVAAFEAAVADLAVSGDAGLVAAVSRDARIRLWNAGSDFGAAEWTNKQLPDSGSFSALSGGNSIDALVDPGGSTLMVGHASGSVTAINRGTTSPVIELQQVRPRHQFLRVSPDGGSVLAVSPAFASARLQALANTGLTVLRREGSAWAASAVDTKFAVVDAAWTYDPDTIAVLDSDKRLVFGTLKGNVFSETGSESIGSASDPARLATAARAAVTAVASQDGTVVILDRGRRTQFAAPTPVRDVVLSGDGKYVVAIGSGPRARTVVWDVAQGKTAALEVQDWISDAAFDAASQTLVLGSDPRGELVSYDLRNMREQGRWVAHADGIRVVAFSADGTLLHSAGNDGVVKSWSSKALAELRTAPPRAIRERLEQATGLSLSVDGTIRSRVVPMSAAALAMPTAVNATDDPEGARTSRAVLALESGDKDPLAAACGSLGDPGHAGPDRADLGEQAAAAICADATGRADLASARYESFYEAAVEQGTSPGRLRVGPGAARGAGAYLERSVLLGRDQDLSQALRLINLLYLNSWRSGSLLRLPPNGLVRDYVSASDGASGPTTLEAINQRSKELIDGLGPGWPGQAASPGEAEAIPRLLFSIGVAYLSQGDAPGAYEILVQASDLAAKAVSGLVRSGNSLETEARQLWAQTLAGSAVLACEVGAQARDDKVETVNGRTVSDLMARSRESASQAAEQWRLLGERNAQNDETRQSIATLRDTWAWCGRLAAH